MSFDWELCRCEAFFTLSPLLVATYIALMFSSVLPLVVGISHPAIAVYMNVTCGRKGLVRNGQGQNICYLSQQMAEKMQQNLEKSTSEMEFYKALFP